MAPIAHPNNEHVPRLRALRSRQERERTGTYYIEGARIVMQAIQAGVAFEMGVISPGLLGESDYGWEVVAALRAAGVPLVELTAAAFGSISFKENLQGLGAVVRPRWERLSDIELTGLGWVALDAVGNTGNIGAVLRTCDAVGCAGLILLGTTTDPHHPAAVRASMGAIFSQRLVRATFEEFVDWKNARHYPVIGTSGSAEREFRELIFPTPMVLLMGSERLGLSPEQQAICDLTARIPMVGTS